MSGQGKNPFVPMLEEVKWEWTSESRISTVIGLLPTSLQSRMGPFRHFRRSVSLGSLRTTGELDATLMTSKQRPVSVGATTTFTDGNVAADKQGDGCSQPDMSELTVVSRKRSSRDAEIPSPSGINWRFAQQGTNLIGIAADANADEENGAFERKAYLDGLSYLLRSLPSDLDTYESDQIRAALPVKLAPKDPSSGRPGAIRLGHASRIQKSIIHRLVQAIVLNIFLLVHLVLPYVVIVVKSAASVERRYKVSEAIVGHGVSCFSAAGRHCARAAEVVLTANDGKVGQGVSSSFAWTVEEVTRGISDGVGEGLVVTRWKDAARESPGPS